MAYPGGRQHKYRAVRTDCNAGHSHPSKAEARRCDELHLLQRAGEISRLEMQPRYTLSIGGVKLGSYVGDFRYFTSQGCVLEDVKGMKTPLYNWKKKHLEAQYAGVKIVEVR
jgi:hypothetical protein